MTRSSCAHLLRELVRSPLVGATLAVTLPVWYELGRGHDDVRTSAMLAVVGGAALVGIAFDEPAQATLNACAVHRSARRWSRTVLVASVLAAGWAVVALVAHLAGAEPGPVGPRLPEAAAAAALASAFAAVGLRAGVRTPGLTAAMATVGAMASSTAASFWWSDLRWLPRLADPGHARRWWTTAVLGLVVAAWWARDPGSRTLASRLSRPSARHPRSGSRPSVQMSRRSAP